MAQFENQQWEGISSLFRTNLLNALAFLAVAATYLLPVTVAGIGLSHLIGIALILATFPVVLHKRSRETSAVFLIFTGIFLAGAISGFALGPGPRFSSDLTKQIIIFMITFFAGLALDAKSLYSILRFSPWFCAVFLVGVFGLSGNPFSYGGRLALEGFASSNVLGYVIVLSIAVLLAPARRSRAELLLLAILLIMMLMTLSRSALLATMAVFWVRLGLLRGFALFAPPAIGLGLYFFNNQMIQRMLVVEDVMTSGGSGRLDLWRYLIDRYLSTPEAWLFGFGPGSIHRRVNMLVAEDSAHSVILDMLYFYGIPGFVLVIATVAAAWFGLARTPQGAERNLARDIVIITVVNGLVDVSFDASGINVLSALFFAFIVSVLRKQQSQLDKFSFL